MKRLFLWLLYDKKWERGRGEKKEFERSKKGAHNPKVVSSSLTPATKVYITRTVTVLVIFCCPKTGCNNA